MVDGTIGEGGHSEAFLARFAGLRIIGVDADADIIEIAKKRLAGFGDRIRFVHGWSHGFFKEMVRPEFAPCDPGGVKQPDTILLDLGVSLFHYEKSGRGFSFRRDGALDMRIDTSRGESAAALIARLDERALADLLYENAEERYSRRIARAIVEARRAGPIKTAAALATIIHPRGVPSGRVMSNGRYRVPRGEGGGVRHPATKTFAALRIAVNGELARLPELLGAAFGALKPGGRLGVITFHSLEDRIVKNFFRDRAREGAAVLVTKKPVSATEKEARENPPSRSAKLRVIEKG
jgi:16S rRNA (cytosine1402-N4)-methyltransferase